MDYGARLRRDFTASQEAAMRRALARQRRARITGSAGGGVAGLCAVAVAAMVTGQEIFWHSFLLETMLGMVAGYFLARRGGGMLAGMIYFLLAYFLAFQIRVIGFDAGSLFSPTDLRLAIIGQGHMFSLAILVGFGGLVGFMSEN
jgi:hypothetical protein